MPLELILTMQGQFGSCRALRGPLGPQNGLFGPLGLFIWPQSGPKCHIIMFYTCGKCFKVIWGLSWQNTVRSSLYPSWHVIRTKNLNFGTLKNFQWISLPIFFSVHYWPQRVFFVRFYQIWRWCFWEKSTFLHTLFWPKTAQNDHFWPPEELFLAKNLENKMFSVHTIQNFTIWNPNMAPKKVAIFGPTDPLLNPPYPPWHPPGVRGGQKWPKCIPSSPMMLVNAKKAISGGSKILTYFFTRNVPIVRIAISVSNGTFRVKK